MVCEVNTFQARSAVRDVGKALGLPLGLLDRVAKGLERHGAAHVGPEAADTPELAAATRASPPSPPARSCCARASRRWRS